MNKTIMVTGISGQLGRAVLQHLVERGIPGLAGASRTPERHAALAAAGVDLRFADFDATDSLSAAFTGVSDLLLVSTAPTIGEARVAQHGRAIDAAASAGVGRVAYTSLLNADLPLLGRVAIDHLETERRLAGSGMRHLSLRNAFYMDMLLDALPPAILSGRWVTSAGEGPVSYVTRADCALAAAAALSRPASGETRLDVAGQPVNAAQLLEIANDALGVSIALSPVDGAQHIEHLVASGLPAPLAGMMVHIDGAVRQGAMLGSDRDFTRLTGRPPMDVKAFLETHGEQILERARRNSPP
jgi:NAD(P)H dehydrogenase (quinone)